MGTPTAASLAQGTSTRTAATGTRIESPPVPARRADRLVGTVGSSGSSQLPAVRGQAHIFHCSDSSRSYPVELNHGADRDAASAP
jgi:hypothetical protein